MSQQLQEKLTRLIRWVLPTVAGLPEYLTTEEAGWLRRESHTTTWGHIRAKRYRTVKHGSRTKIVTASLLELNAAEQVAAEQAAANAEAQGLKRGAALTAARMRKRAAAAALEAANPRAAAAPARKRAAARAAAETGAP